ncbi:MAG: rod shape-determining protein MreC [Gammaproteobacteria bacterium]|nr:rod shape-determining protein MreC [Gammaproteobacteria bacterium]MBU1645661.1 rod shape-determining protein MreC [Gammaproteobacteria bacterium]MBU1973537.1 rod shape-determining protein MreC [Gammaproteobacteria bacterium]
MSVVGHTPPPFFKRGPAPLARLTFFTALAITLLVADLRFHTLEWARLVLATVAWPMQRAAQMPVEGAQGAGQYFASLLQLQQENSVLRTRSLATANQLLRQEHLEQENRRLRALLDMKERQPVEGRVGEIIYAARDPFSRRVIMDKGLQAGVAAGQAVIDDLGVIGQVTRVFPLTAEVTLLTDKDQAIPVQVQRNGLRAVAAGAGAGSIELRFLAANAEVQVGDILVTSGLDGIYLPGLPVAKIIHIDRDNSYAFARIHCEPIAGVERHGHVLVLGSRIVPPQPEEPVERKDVPAKGKKVRKAAQ